MNSDVIDADARPLAIRDEAEPSNLVIFNTADPVEVITQATRIADALKAVIVAKKLVSNIQGKEYPLVEAWQTLAAMLGLDTICEWTRRVEDGWEARVVVRRHGIEKAAAEAQCTRTERAWSKRDDYALRSMAQTRATSKSLRSVLGFIMVLAGYQATPAEEVPKGGFQDAPEPSPASKPAKAAKPSPAAQETPRKVLLNAQEMPDGSVQAVRPSEEALAGARTQTVIFANKAGLSDDQRHELGVAMFGKASTKQMDRDELRLMYRAIAAWEKARDEGRGFPLWLEAFVKEAK